MKGGSKQNDKLTENRKNPEKFIRVRRVNFFLKNMINFTVLPLKSVFSTFIMTSDML